MFNIHAKPKPIFNLIEQKIFRLLYHQGLPLTIYDIAKEIGVSHQTADKYIKKLAKKSILIEEKEVCEKITKKLFRFNWNLVSKIEKVMEKSQKKITTINKNFDDG